MKKRNVWLLLLASLGIMLTIFFTLPVTNVRAEGTANDNKKQTLAYPDQKKKLIKIGYSDKGSVILYYRMADGSTATAINHPTMNMVMLKDSDKAKLTYYSEFKNSKVNNAFKEAVYKWNKSLSPIGYHLSVVDDPSQAMFTLSTQLSTDDYLPSMTEINTDDNDFIVNGDIHISQFLLNSSSEQLQSSLEHEIGHTLGQADVPLPK